MTEHQNHDHEHEHHGRHGGHVTHKRNPLHKSWFTWLIVGLMLAAMYAYVMTDSESLQPGDPVQGPGVPAAP